RFRAGGRQLVAEGNPGGIILQPAQRNVTLAIRLRVTTRGWEVLTVTVHGRGRILPQNATEQPRGERRRRAGVNAVLGPGAWLTAAQNDPPKVCRTSPVIPFLHLRCDFVVRLRDHLVNSNPVRSVPPGLKRSNDRHE